MQVGTPVDPLQHVPKEPFDVVKIEGRGILASGNPEKLGERQLPLAENRVGLGEQFHRLALLGIRNVTFATDSQQ